MTHTTRIGETAFTHNGDYSGDVTIVGRNGGWTVPFEDLKGLVAQYIASKHIQRLEQADPDEILGIPKKQTNEPQSAAIEWPRCETCEHWGMNKFPNASHSCYGPGNIRSENGIHVTPDFGCVHHKPKDQDNAR